VRIFLIILLSLSLTSCTSLKGPAEVKSSTLSQKSTREAEGGPALYVYNKNQNTKEIRLRYGEDPVAVSNSYLKLVGTINGKRPLALIEIGGRGVSFVVGEKVSGYLVSSINKNEVRLCRVK